MLLSNPKPQLRLISVNLPEDLIDQLKLKAAASGLSMSALIRLILFNYFKEK